MDDLTRERFGRVPWHERGRRTPALIRHRRRVLCGVDEIGRTPTQRLLARRAKDARLARAIRAWRG